LPASITALLLHPLEPVAVGRESGPGYQAVQAHLHVAADPLHVVDAQRQAGQSTSLIVRSGQLVATHIGTTTVAISCKSNHINAVYWAIKL
jgi:hypothetical protein